jgi:hypothetical protein
MSIQDIKLWNTNLKKLLCDIDTSAFANQMEYINANVGCPADCPCKKYGNMVYRIPNKAADEAMQFECPAYIATAELDLSGKTQSMGLGCRVLDILSTVSSISRKYEQSSHTKE